jgi:lipid-A-disaccharide synthase
MIILTTTNKKIFIVAGESSGDFHAANVVNSLNEITSEISFFGIGGAELEKSGVKLIHDFKEINFIGFTKVIKNLKKITGVLNDTVKKIKEIEPDIVILVDFPGFNLKLAEKIRTFYSGKIIYYISPQIWAWHYSRIKKIKKLIDKMLVIFPFEKEMYEKEVIAAEFVGHPLNNRINEYLTENKKSEGRSKIISLMPGSRKEEIERIFPVFIKTGNKLIKEFSCKITVICSENFPIGFYKKFKGTENFNFIINNSSEALYKTILDSDLVITKIGTSSMECALLETPFISGYKAGKMNYLIGKNLVRIDNFAMVNILLKRKAVKEFIQDEMTSENIFNEAKKILTDKKYAEQMKNDFKEMKKILTDMNASQNAAEIISTYL